LKHVTNILYHEDREVNIFSIIEQTKTIPYKNCTFLGVVAPFIFMEKQGKRPGTYCTGDWVGPRAGLDE
jgi:hypothetical protein